MQVGLVDLVCCFRLLIVSVIDSTYIYVSPSNWANQWLAERRKPAPQPTPRKKKMIFFRFCGLENDLERCCSPGSEWRHRRAQSRWQGHDLPKVTSLNQIQVQIDDHKYKHNNTTIQFNWVHLRWQGHDLPPGQGYLFKSNTSTNTVRIKIQS